MKKNQNDNGNRQHDIKSIQNLMQSGRNKETDPNNPVANQETKNKPKTFNHQQNGDGSKSNSQPGKKNKPTTRGITETAVWDTEEEDEKKLDKAPSEENNGEGRNGEAETKHKNANQNLHPSNS